MQWNQSFSLQFTMKNLDFLLVPHQVHIKKFWQLENHSKTRKFRPLNCNGTDMGEEKQMIAIPQKQKWLKEHSYVPTLSL